MNKQWIQLTIADINSKKGILISILDDRDTVGIEEYENKIIAYFSQEKQNKISTIIDILKRNQPAITVSVNIINNQNWHLNWQNQFDRVEVTNKIAIVPAWQETQGKSEIEIIIKPGMAFGTGAHETTQLTLKLLEEYIQSGDRILDAGCGSGILTIAALKLGAKFVEARDISPDIQDNFYEQIKLNGIKTGFNLEITDITQLEKFPFDLILSNIQRNINQKFLQKISTSDFDGIVIFTGLLKKEEHKFTQSIQKSQQHIIKKEVKNDWLAYVVK